jgi:hypothetical protein
MCFRIKGGKRGKCQTNGNHPIGEKLSITLTFFHNSPFIRVLPLGLNPDLSSTRISHEKISHEKGFPKGYVRWSGGVEKNGYPQHVEGSLKV